jgi:UDP-glucose 4-epimerase
MRVLITGAAGYIGSVATLVLREAGHEVIALDNLSQGHRDATPEDVRFIQADVRDIAKVLQSGDGIDAVIHLAAFIAAGESMAKPELYWQNNVVQTLQFLDGLRQLHIKKVIFASTAAVYGNPEQQPITEDAATRPTNTYGMTKLAMDMAITSECIAHGVAATSLRFFNVAGAYGSAGERHRAETHIIPLALRAAETGETFTIFGDDYPTPDGTCIRDYIHVTDLVQAMLLALETQRPGEHNIYNLGNGNGFSNKQVVAAVQDVTGRRLAHRILPRRPGDPAVLIASSQKIRSELGWEPRKPSLESMIVDAWEFYQRQAQAVTEYKQTAARL